MKTFVVWGASIVLVGIFFCPIVMAAPTLPSDVQIGQPDPSLPKELSTFCGKWECDGENVGFIIVEKIDEEKASLYIWERFPGQHGFNWIRREGKVIKERGKYKIWYTSSAGNAELTSKGENLIFTGADWGGPSVSLRLKRVK